MRGRLALTPDEEAAALLERVLSEKPCLSIKDLAVGGNDLLAAGFPAGTAVGQALRALLAVVLDGKCENEPAALLALAAELKEEMQ